VLRRLVAGGRRPALVITQPDRPRGRGRRLESPPVASAARELGLEVIQPESLNADGPVARIRSLADTGVVCAFGQLIREPLLSELELLNVHPSLIPRWRGAAPIERAIMAGDEVTGVTIMRVTEGLDSGPVALQEPLAIEQAGDYASLSGRLAELSGELVMRALELRERGELGYTDQDEDAATYAEKIRPEERRVEPARPAAELARIVRALTPHIGAYLELADGSRLAVRRARAEEGDLRPGDVSGDGVLRVGCAEGVLRLEVVQPAGGKAMEADAYLRGHPPPRLPAA
jgi:methionyl-tRNA formyltransferase